jgi:hypothetical protein
VNEDYRVLGREITQLADVSEQSASIFKVTRGQTLSGLFAPATDGKVHHQVHQFLIDADNLLSTNRTISKTVTLKLSYA